MGKDAGTPRHSEVKGMEGEGFASPALLPTQVAACSRGRMEPKGHTALPGRQVPAVSILVGLTSALILTPHATLFASVPNPETQNHQQIHPGKASYLPASLF